MRKSVVTTLATGLVLACVASCAETTSVPEDQPPKNPTSALVSAYNVESYGDLENLDPSGHVVTYWHQYTGSTEELLSAMVDTFNRTNEWGVIVFAESQAYHDDLHQQLAARIRTGRLPSAATIHPYQAAAYAAQGALVALDPYVKSENWGYSQKELNDFFPVALTADILPQLGVRYGWPLYKSMEVLYYNEDWLAELGYAGPPDTWDEFAEMACAAASQPFSGATGEGTGYGYIYALAPSQFATFVFSRCGNILTEEGTQYIFNNAAGLESLTFLQELAERGCVAEQRERYGDRSEFGAGRSLFTISSISGLAHYTQAVNEGAGFKWSITAPPRSADCDAPRVNIYGASQSIFRTNPEEQLAAWLFIKWVSEPEQQATWASGTGYLATRQSTADLLSDYLAKNPTYGKAFGFMSLDYGVEPPVAGYDGCRNAIAEMLTGVLEDEEIQAQLDAVVGQCNAYLEEAAP